MPDIQVLVRDVGSKLKKGKMEGSQATARVTAELLRSVISQHRERSTNAAAALIEAVRSVGELLVDANPVELAVGKNVRRVLHIIREEDSSPLENAVGGLKLSAEIDVQDIIDGENNQDLSTAAIPAICLSHPPSLRAIVDSLSNSATVCQTSALGDGVEGKGKCDKSARSGKLKHEVIKAVNELIEDIDTCHEQIAEQAVDHIHHKQRDDLLMFYCGGHPQGHDLAKKLSKKGLNAIVITDSAIFAMASRVNMVIVRVHAVMANGGVVAPVGLNMVALAVQKHGVPFVVVAGIHEVCRQKNNSIQSWC